MLNPALCAAMRLGAEEKVAMAYYWAGDPLCFDLCQRTFILYMNGDDVATCADFLRGYCYRQFHGGQMEQVLDDLVCVSYLPTPADVLACVHALREFGIAGEIWCEVEYAQGYPVYFKSYR